MSWFLFNALVVLFFVWIITKKYGTLLNPASYAGGLYLMQAVIAPLLYESFDLFNGISRAFTGLKIETVLVVFERLYLSWRDLTPALPSSWTSHGQRR